MWLNRKNKIYLAICEDVFSPDYKFQNKLTSWRWIPHFKKWVYLNHDWFQNIHFFKRKNRKPKMNLGIKALLKSSLKRSVLICILTALCANRMLCCLFNEGLKLKKDILINKIILNSEPLNQSRIGCLYSTFDVLISWS